MGSDSGKAKRGFCLQDVRCTGALNLATPTEAGPRPGSQVPSSASSRLVPVVSGAQGASIDTYVTVSGDPNSDPIAREGLAAIWRLSGGTWQGYSGPGFIHSQDQIAEWAADPEGYATHDAVTIPSTQKVVAFYGQTAGSDPLLYNSRTLDPADWLWDAEVTIVSVSTPEKVYDGALCVLGDPDETVLLIRSYVDANGVDAWGVLASTDAGATWSTWSTRPFATITSALTPSPIARSRMVASGDDVLFMREYSTYAVQFASKSLGATFTQVGSDWTVSVPTSISLVSLGGGAFGALFETGSNLKFARIGSAYESIEDAVHVTVLASTVTASTLWMDDLGVLWAAITTDGVTLVYSRDRGDTWTGLQASFPLGADHHESGDSGSEFAPDTATMSCGRLILIGNSVASGGASTYNGRVWAVQSGGWSNLEFQGWRNSTASNGITWLSYELPTTVSSWTETTTTGAATLVTPGKMEIDFSGGADDISWLNSTGDTAARDVVALIDLDLVSGGSLTANQVGCQIHLGDGTDRTDLEINVFDDDYAVYDRNATASRGTFDFGTAAARVQILIYVTYANGTPTCSTWHRTAGADAWTAGAVAVSATLATDAANTDFIWGQQISSTTKSNWYQAHWTWSDTDGALAIAEAAATFRGKALNPLPSALPTAVADSGRAAFLSAISGPGIVAETHDIDAEHDYPKEAASVDISPSSTKKHRTTDETATILFEFSPNEAGEFQTNPGNTTIFVYFEGINWRTGTLKGSTDGGATFPTTIGTFDASIGDSIPYALFGEDAVEIDSTSSGSHARYVWNQELVGGTVLLQVSPGNDAYRRILRNTEGAFNADATTRQARLWLESVTGGESTPDVMDVWAPRGVMVIHNVGAYDRYRFTIDAQTTADGYFETGRAMFGSVHPAGRQWSKGFSITDKPNARTRGLPDGARRVKRLGPMLRDAVVAWPDGVDMTGLRGGNPNYLAADTGDPLAAEDDVAYWLGGVIDYTESGKWPVVLLMDIPDTDTTITDRSLFLCGHIESSASFNHVHGLEGSTELGRVQSVKIGELP